MARDPIEYRGRSWTLYAYVNANPLSSLDPSGLVVLERHHWFMRYWGSRSGQAKVDRLCQCPKINIDRYTTEYTREEHDWIHSWHGYDVGITYRGQYERILDSSVSCCDLLTKMLGMMLAWDILVDLAHDNGLISGENGPEFDLISYRTKVNPPKSMLPDYMNKLRIACGSNLNNTTIPEAFEIRDQIIERIRKYDGMYPSVGETLHDMLFPGGVPVGTPGAIPSTAPGIVPSGTPTGIPQPIGIPQPAPA